LRFIRSEALKNGPVEVPWMIRFAVKISRVYVVKLEDMRGEKVSIFTHSSLSVIIAVNGSQRSEPIADF